MGLGRKCVFGGVAAASALSSLAPAWATVYRTPGREVMIATEGEEAYGKYLSVSHGGRADTWQGVAVSTTGDAYGYLAVSGTGCGYSNFIIGASVTGCASGGAFGVSGLGPVVDHPISNGNVFYGASLTGCVIASDVAVSGTGCANGGVALSGTGDAQARPDFSTGVPFTYAPGVGLSGGGDARGGSVTVAGLGDSHAGSQYDYTSLPHVAVSGAGDASNNRPTGLTVAPVGRSDGGAVAVGGDDTTAHGGLAAVSLTGDAHGGSVANVCPMGRCS